MKAFFLVSLLSLFSALLVSIPLKTLGPAVGGAIFALVIGVLVCAVKSVKKD